jgi:ATP-dependent DNA helicase RecG
MVTRPEILYPMFSSTMSLKGIGEATYLSLEKAGINKVKDLIFTLPLSFIDRQQIKTVAEILKPEVVTVEIEVLGHTPPIVRNRPFIVRVKDCSVEFNIIFFRARVEYLKKLLPIGSKRLISGKLEFFDNLRQMTHPDYIIPLGEKNVIPRFDAVYPLTKGITQKIFAKSIKGALEAVPVLSEWIDRSKKLDSQWPDWQQSVWLAHTPKDQDALSLTNPARERLAYDEFFAHQLTLAIARLKMRQKKGFSTLGGKKVRDAVISRLNYSLTSSQEQVIAEILSDMAAPIGMYRLLQGDVGSGKTIVAFLSLLTAVDGGGQGVIMAPTEILARQHFDSFVDLANLAGVRIELLTGRDTGKKRTQKLEDLSKNEIQILVGTHAVFQKDIIYSSLRLVVIDEQHRFGVNQRSDLIDKGVLVDVLVMTATPIPRSLALASFGDMEISIIDEKPTGRKPIKTAILSESRIDEVIKKLSLAIEKGDQAYWVCPLVEESDLSDKAAAEARFQTLQLNFKEGVVGLVHGQMSTKEKDAAMKSFVLGDTKLLVATTVIEVGVDVPNATIMVIERAESFGLSQLHQLRGRVGRGILPSTCLLIYKSPLSQTGLRRLSILRETEDGFKIAEEDLRMRGSGDLIGTAQSGLAKFRIADLEKQGPLMAIAHSDARKLLNDDPRLESERGLAARHLLWLMEKSKVIKLIKIG